MFQNFHVYIVITPDAARLSNILPNLLDSLEMLSPVVFAVSGMLDKVESGVSAAPNV